MTTLEVLQSTTPDVGLDLAQTASALEALEEVTRASTSCAMAMIAEDDVGDLVTAIRSDLDSADIAQAAVRVLSRTFVPNREVVHAVVTAAIAAAARSNSECSKHASHHTHCRLCSEATSHAIEVCGALLEDPAGN